jgi:hypothetical protein
LPTTATGEVIVAGVCNVVVCAGREGRGLLKSIMIPPDGDTGIFKSVSSVLFYSKICKILQQVYVVYSRIYKILPSKFDVKRMILIYNIDLIYSDDKLYKQLNHLSLLYIKNQIGYESVSLLYNI